MSTPRVTVTHEGGLARITLSRPDTRNAIDLETITELGAAVAAIDPTSVGAVLIDAEGSDFSVGGDLSAFPETSEGLAEFTQNALTIANQMMNRLYALPVPLIVAAQGAIAGGAIGIVLVGDIILLADDAKIASAYARIGMSPELGVSWLLARTLTPAQMGDILLSGRTIHAEEALRVGLVSRVVPAAELAKAAHELAARLASGVRPSLVEIKRLSRVASHNSFAKQLEDERDTIKRVVLDADSAVVAREVLGQLRSKSPAR